MDNEIETVEALQTAIEAIVAKYGYKEISIDYTTHPDYLPHAVTVTYPDGKAGTGTGRTLRAALSAASADALKPTPA